MRHDPPWKAEQINGIWTVTTDREDHTDEYDVNEDPDEQTVRLEAAAPELLAACQAVVATIDESDEIWSKDQKEYRMAEKAIAKATVAIEQPKEKP